MLTVLVIVAIRSFAKRAEATRAAHQARLSAMAQVHLAAARKKKAADTAAALNAAAPQTVQPPPIPADVAPVRDERDCPFCAEPILKKARVCKHCGRDVDALG